MSFRTVLKVVAFLVGALVLAVGGVWALASRAASAHLGREIPTHDHDFDIPRPLTQAELDELRAEILANGAEGAAPPAGGDPVASADPLEGIDRTALATERAVTRGRHLVEARYGCAACHGEDYGGGAMIDDPAFGRVLGPNLTTGKGGRTSTFTARDWDRIVRHGVKPDGTVALMPSVDNFRMSDEELGDIVTFLRSLPPVDRTVESSTLGPIGRILVATGGLPSSADQLADHFAPHAPAAPAASPTVEFGAHLSQGCTGCHRADLSGGPVIGGDPSWPAASNLTPGPDGLASHTYESFWATVTTGVRADGTALRAPMSGLSPYLARTTEVERQALWAFFQSLPPKEDGR